MPTAQIATAEAPIDHYHAAFENGTMDDETAGHRIKELRRKIVQLQGQRGARGGVSVPCPPNPERRLRRVTRAHAVSDRSKMIGIWAAAPRLGSGSCRPVA